MRQSGADGRRDDTRARLGSQRVSHPVLDYLDLIKALEIPNDSQPHYVGRIAERCRASPSVPTLCQQLASRGAYKTSSTPIFPRNGCRSVIMLNP